MTQAVQTEQIKQTQETVSKKGRQPFISLRVKLLVGFTLVFSLVFGIAYYWFYNFATNVAVEKLRQDLHNALVGTAANIDGDVLLALFNEAEPRESDGFTDDERYWEIADWLHNVHEVNDEVWPYTYIAGDEPNEVFYVVSSAALETPPWGVAFKEREITQSNRLQSGLVEPLTFLDQPYEWQDTLWVSGFAPIRSFSTGEVIAGLGMDYRFSYVLSVQASVRDRAIPAFLITYGVLFLLVYILSNGFSRPIISLTRIAQRIGEGDYDQDLSRLKGGVWRDEISQLADVFDAMIGKVEQREVKLKEKVAELQIIVDQGKRDMQVSEIVESDFFQDLQLKAKEMRQRKYRAHTEEDPVPETDPSTSL